MKRYPYSAPTWYRYTYQTATGETFSTLALNEWTADRLLEESGRSSLEWTLTSTERQ